jgi:YfiH family protein
MLKLKVKIFERYKGKIVYGITDKRDGNMSAKFDKVGIVYKRREKVLKRFGFGLKDIVLLEQKHTANVRIARRKHLGFALKSETPFKPADALITKEKNIVLGIFIADCLPVFFYDPKKEIISLAHAGWKGLYKGIIQNVIKKFKNLGSSPQNILIYIGPSIGPCHYNVEEERINLFKEKYPFLDKSFYRKAKGKYYLNLWKIAKLFLIKEGLKNRNIEISQICTYCHKNLFSYRREKEKEEKSGQMFAFFAMKS